MSMSVRSANALDLDGIRAYGRRVLPPFYESIGLSEYGEMTLAQYWESDEQVAAIIEGQVIVGDLDGRLIGVAEVGTYDGEPIIWKLYVEPAMRRRGLGRKLVDADELGARRFSIPDAVWDAMGPAERWAANQAVLDQAIADRMPIVLSNPATPEFLTGTFGDEIAYLIKQGYEIGPDALSMVPGGS